MYVLHLLWGWWGDIWPNIAATPIIWLATKVTHHKRIKELHRRIEELHEKLDRQPVVEIEIKEGEKDASEDTGTSC
jgi:hypothetical protein